MVVAVSSAGHPLQPRLMGLQPWDTVRVACYAQPLIRRRSVFFYAITRGAHEIGTSVASPGHISQSFVSPIREGTLGPRPRISTVGPSPTIR
jgi:hypothetical protein